ncbi:effector binding domain-containing protein [Vagococcus sp. JNUCC 83]
MNLSIVESIRTNNFNDKNIETKMTNLWKCAIEKIQKIDTTIYAIYHDYQSDFRGDYTCSICIRNEYEENNSNNINILDNTKYRMFKVDSSVDNSIFNTWKLIWEQEEKGLLNRSYTYDYEKYYSQDNIEIYIAIQ